MPRRLVLSVFGLVAVLAVAGVLLFADGKDTVPLSTVANAAEATNRAGGFRITIDGRYQVPGAGQVLPMKGEGALDPQNRRGRLVFQTAGALGGGGGIEQVFEGDVIYMKMPAAAQRLGMKKSWLKVDVKEAGRALGIDPGQLGQLGGNDPRQMIDQIRAVSGEVERQGTEVVRGVETTRYRAEVDIRRYPDRLPPAQREQARVAVEKLVEQTGSDTYPMTLWIGDDDLVRRVRIEYDFDMPGQEKKAEFSMTMEFFDFGARVNVAAPPEKDVQDLSELAAAFGGQGGGVPQVPQGQPPQGQAPQGQPPQIPQLQPTPAQPTP